MRFMFVMIGALVALLVVADYAVYKGHHAKAVVRFLNI